AAVVAAGGVRVPEHAARQLAVRVGVLALREQVAPAVEARAAGDRERHHHAVAAAQLAHAGPDLLHDADELVAERRADARVRDQPAVQVQVRAAKGGRGDPQDDVERVLDLRVLLVLDPEVRRAVVDRRLHVLLLPSGVEPRPPYALSTCAGRTAHGITRARAMRRRVGLALGLNG